MIQGFRAFLTLNRLKVMGIAALSGRAAGSSVDQVQSMG
jgi:hypothetical protein